MRRLTSARYASVGGSCAQRWADQVPLTDYWAILPAISPDGNLIAAGYQDEQQIPHLAIIPSVGGKPIKLVSFLPSVVPFAGFAWTADCNSLVYVQKRNAVLCWLAESKHATSF